MSTAAERAFRAARHIMPIKVTVKGNTHHVDADTRRSGKAPLAVRIEEEEAVREVRRALNAWYYGDN
jgi:hypothetical protein